jgi:putative chitobiose transport system permease protein
MASMSSSPRRGPLRRLRGYYRMKHPKSVNRSTLGNASVTSFLLVMAVFTALPLVYTVVNAFKPLNELFIFPPRFFVQHPTFDNFSLLFQLAQNLWVPFARYLFNSLFIAVVGTGAYVVIASMCAYPLAKMKLKGGAFFSTIIVFAILFRPEVTGIPQYIVISKLGLVNTPWSLILPAMASSLGVFLMRQFMVTLPDPILESARIDGCSEFRLFWKIVMPSVRPAWLTLIIFTFQLLWNTNGVQYIYDETWKTVPAMLAQIAVVGSIARAGAGAAAALFLMIPPIVIFIASQSSIMQTMTHSGIK